MDYARRLFDGIPPPGPDLFMHNAMLRGYAHAGAPHATFAVYRHMETAGLRPDGFTFCYLLRACCAGMGLLACSSAGWQVHAVVVKIGFLEDAFVRNALINMHAKCGDLGVAGMLLGEASEQDIVPWSAVIAGHAARGNLDVARQMFDQCRHKDIVCWNVMLGAYVKHGEMEKARELFDCAPEKDVVSWNTIITGYSMQGMLDQALEAFDEMRSAGWVPDDATIVSLLSCCASAATPDWSKVVRGLLDEAFAIVSGMRRPSAVVWRTLLGACRTHGNVALGKIAQERLLSLSGDESGDYVLLSGIYSSYGEWSKVETAAAHLDLAPPLILVGAGVAPLGAPPIPNSRRP
nr:unnamed protein product [Digitaria exilis]